MAHHVQTAKSESVQVRVRLKHHCILCGEEDFTEGIIGPVVSTFDSFCGGCRTALNEGCTALKAEDGRLLLASPEETKRVLGTDAVRGKIVRVSNTTMDMLVPKEDLPSESPEEEQTKH